MGVIRSIKDKINKGRQIGGMPMGVGGGGSKAGVYINEENSMRYAAVQACVRVLSEDIAALPLYLYRRTGQGGKERASGHPLYRILRMTPNPEMTAISFKEALMVNVLLTGNAYAFIEMNGAGRVIALWPMVSSDVTPYRSGSGAIRYRAGSVDLSAAEVLHIPGLGFDGLVGMSPITYARESIGLGLAAEQFGGQFFKNGTHLGGVISVPTKLSDEAFERTKTQFQQMYRGLQNAHGVPLLEGGATYQQIGIAPEDAQFLETRKYQRSEIAGIFRVPPHMLGDLEHATFSNIEHQDISYLQRSLLPWLTRIEQAMTVKLLTAEEQKEYVIEHETGSFMRGDTKSRFEAYAIGITNGILSVNEARGKENLNPVDGGDEILRPLNMDVIGSDRGTGGDDGAGTGGGARSFRLAGLEDFTADGRRQAVRRAKSAAKGLGVTQEHIEALKRALSPWLREQAERLKKIVKEQARALDNAERIMGAINAYYKELARIGLPEEANSAIAAICGDARTRLRLAHGDKADVIDDEWMSGFLKRYNADMSARLIEANRAEAARLVYGAEQDEIDGLMAKLNAWGGERAENMANMETMLAANELIVAANRKMGYASLWISGAGCCQICQGMNGQTITTIKPPLHKGCTCTVTAKVFGAFNRRDNYSGTTYGIDKSGKYARISVGDELDTEDGPIQFKRWVNPKNEKVIARGEEIDDIERLIQFYGGTREGWRKMKNIAVATEENGQESQIDIHWYEHDKNGRVDYKTK